MVNTKVRVCEVKRSISGSATKHTYTHPKGWWIMILKVLITAKAMVNNLAHSWVRSLVTQHPHITF
jgi:hypothetical protein